jgi:trimethylamine:corrinoid methyltransferase-like protein
MHRTGYEAWEPLGSKTMDAKLEEKADETLNTHRAAPIDRSLLESINGIIKGAEG